MPPFHCDFPALHQHNNNNKWLKTCTQKRAASGQSRLSPHLSAGARRLLSSTKSVCVDHYNLFATLLSDKPVDKYANDLDYQRLRTSLKLLEQTQDGTLLTTDNVIYLMVSLLRELMKNL